MVPAGNATFYVPIPGDYSLFYFYEDGYTIKADHNFTVEEWTNCGATPCTLDSDCQNNGRYTLYLKYYSQLGLLLI